MCAAAGHAMTLGSGIIAAHIIVPCKSHHASLKLYYMSSHITHTNVAHTLTLNTHWNDYGTEVVGISEKPFLDLKNQLHRDLLELLPR